MGSSACAGGSPGGRPTPKSRSSRRPVVVVGRAFYPLVSEFANWVFLALTENRLGHADSTNAAAFRARATLAEANADSVWDKAEIELLAAELDAALPPVK